MLDEESLELDESELLEEDLLDDLLCLCIAAASNLALISFLSLLKGMRKYQNRSLKCYDKRMLDRCNVGLYTVQSKMMIRL